MDVHVGRPRALLALVSVLLLACAPSRPSSRDWAQVPMAGAEGVDRLELVELVTNPDAHQGRTVRMSLRVAGTYRDARGVWLRVVPAHAPMTAEYVKLLIPKSAGGREYLETAGRDLEVVLRVERPVATMAYETAFEVTPLAHVSRFTPSSRGGEDASAVRGQMDATP